MGTDRWTGSVIVLAKVTRLKCTFFFKRQNYISSFTPKPPKYQMSVEGNLGRKSLNIQQLFGSFTKNLFLTINFQGKVLDFPLHL